MSVTVGELIQELEELPQDFKVTVTVGGEVCEYPEIFIHEQYGIIDMGTT